MANIAFFNVHTWEADYLKTQLKGHTVQFYTESIEQKHVKKLQNTDVISLFIHSHVPEAIVKQLPNLKAICLRSTGFDNVDLAACKKQGVAVCNVPFYGENTVAEHAMGLLLSLSTRTHEVHQRVEKGNYSTEGVTGFDLKDKTIGIIGGGHIGMHAVKMAKGFGMKILVYDIFKNDFLREVLGYEYVSLQTLLKKSDIISLHVPYNKYTHHIINKKNLKDVKKGCVLINTARGACVEAGALQQGLQKGIFSAAGLDVLEDEEVITHPELFDKKSPKFKKLQKRNMDIIKRENVLFTPHNAFNSKEALYRILDTSVSNIKACLNGKPTNKVN